MDGLRNLRRCRFDGGNGGNIKDYDFDVGGRHLSNSAIHGALCPDGESI